jgi:diphthamide synthase (EF-2-diphthine--ammonia ligase)
MDRRQLVLDMLDTGIKTMIVSCNEKMGQDFIGRVITKEIIDEFESIGIDPCGENGEYHTLVLDCPLFSEEVQVQLLETEWHQQYWFAKLVPQQKR